MSDRKYRHRGYRDEPRDPPSEARPARREQEPGAPAGARRLSQDGPRAIAMPGFREVVRCTQCGTIVGQDLGLLSRCPRCGTDLHTCAQCSSFDPGSRFECSNTALTARVSPKNERNACAFYAPRTTVERETTAPRENDARKAFDDLFNI